MGVDHGGFDIFVAEEFLHGADVVSVLEQVGGVTMAKYMRGDALVYVGLARGGFDGFLQAGFVDMVALFDAGLGIERKFFGGEEILPGEFAAGVGVFFGDGSGQVYRAEAFGQVFLVKFPNALDLFAQGGNDAGRQGGRAVICAFAIANDDLAVVEIDVFDAQAQAFHQTQSAAVEYLGHEQVDSGELVEYGFDFGFVEDGGQDAGAVGADDLELFLIKFDVEYVAVEEQDGAEGLVLGGGGDVVLGDEVGDVGVDFCDAHFARVAFFVEEDVAAHPFGVCLDGAWGVLFCAHGIAELVE